MSIRDEILDYLKRNRVSTTEVADALGKKGALEGVMPINRGHYKVGTVKWVYAFDCSNWSLHDQIQDIDENCIIFIDSYNCDNRALFGELVSKYLLLYRQSKAIVANGYVRDAAALIRQNWPIWCLGFNPIGCFNKKPDNDPDMSLINQMKNLYNDSIAVCDDCGVVIIPKLEITELFLSKLESIENQEDVWFDRLDHYKENTFEIVCKKNYLIQK